MKSKSPTHPSAATHEFHERERKRQLFRNDFLSSIFPKSWSVDDIVGGKKLISLASNKQLAVRSALLHSYYQFNN